MPLYLAYYGQSGVGGGGGGGAPTDDISVLSVTEHIPVSLGADPYTSFSITLDASTKAVVLLTAKTFATDHIQTSGHTFGGVAMSHVGSTSQVATATEGSVHAMFLGAGLPAAGSRAFSIDLNGTSSDPYAMYAIQLTGSGDMEVVDWDVAQEEQANPDVALSYAGRKCLAVGVLYSGHDDVSSVTPLTGMTVGINSEDWGNQIAVAAYQTTASTSDFTFGWTAVSDDVALIALALSVIGS